MVVDTEDSQIARDVHKGRKFIIDLQPKRSGGNRTAACRGCRTSFEPGEIRVCPLSKKKSRGGWYVHLDCVHSGWQADDRAQAEDAIVHSHAQELGSRGVQVSPAIAAAESQDAQMGDASELAAPANQTGGSSSTPRHRASDESGGNAGFEGNVLHNLEWWANVDVTKAIRCNAVRTWEGAHPSLEQSLEEAKLAILKLIKQRDDNWETAWRLLLLYDRLMYARMPAKLRPQGISATQ